MAEINFETLEQRFSKLGNDIHGFIENIFQDEKSLKDFRPAADVVLGEDTYTLYMDLPGMSKKEVKISQKDHVLTISGERISEADESDTFIRRERKTGRFSRSFALPDGVDVRNIKAVFRNGTLKVTLPKSASGEEADNINIE